MVTALFAVDDIDVAEAFYERLLGREPDVRMGEDFIEWEVVPGLEAQAAVRVDATLSTCDFNDPFGNPLGFLQVHET